MTFVSPQWKFVLVNTNDLSQIGNLKKAMGKEITLIHNRPGSVKFSYSMQEDYADQIWPYTKSIKAYRRSGSGNWICKWSGRIITVEEDFDNNKMTIGCAGWLDWLGRRYTRRAKDYRSINPATSSYWTDAEIIIDLVQEANETNLTWDVDPGTLLPYSVPIISGADPATPTLMDVGPTIEEHGSFHPTHERRYRIEKYANILSEIYKLTDIENGCDIRVDPETRVLTVYDRRETVTTKVFGYNTGPKNSVGLTRQIDTGSTINYLSATASPDIAPAYADTQSLAVPTTDPPGIGTNSMLLYGLQEEFMAVQDAKSTTVLETLAAGEVFFRATPRMVYAFKPMSYATDIGPGRIPEPLVDYDVGDSVLFSAKAGNRLDVHKQQVRIFGITISPDENNNEVVSQLQISPS